MIKKILITGNMGYVGSVLIEHLNKVVPECDLVGFDAGLFAHCLTFQEAFPERVLKNQIFGDIRTISVDDLKDIDVIIHLCAVSNDPMGAAFEEQTLTINYEATARLALLAKEVGVKKFVFASSCSMYGAGGEKIKTETSELQPLTAYAKSKCLSETALEKLANDDFSVTCLRFSTACGMSPRLRLDLVLNDFVASAITNSEITVLSDGSPWRPLIHVKDMARAFQWASFDHQQSFLVINIGDDKWNYQIKDLAEHTAKMLNVKLNINTQTTSDNRSYKVSFAKFKKLAPDYQPQVTLKDAINDLVQGLKGFDDKEFRSSYLMRLHTLIALVEKNELSKDLLWLNKSK